MEYHPTANLFPLMHGDEFRALVDDIKRNGLIIPITLSDGKILDGRNRHRACEEAGVKPTFIDLDNADSTVEFVVLMNLRRRHLTADQRAVIGVEILPALENEARERQAHGQTAPGRTLVEVFPQADSGKSRDKAAAIVGVNSHYISDMKKLKDEQPVLAAEIRSGDETIQGAKRKVKERQREAVREENRRLVGSVASVASHVKGKTYQAIVIDPPWSFSDEGDIDPRGQSLPSYSTMPIEEIASLPVGDIAADNAHIYLWITNRSLPKGFALLDGWGFRHVTNLTWVKPSFGVGNYFRGSTEHILFGVRGSLPLLRNDVGTHFLAPRPDRTLPAGNQGQAHAGANKRKHGTSRADGQTFREAGRVLSDGRRAVSRLEIRYFRPEVAGRLGGIRRRG